ncbi:MAG: tRNA guanosine(34) transglycosylase Tgt [Chloroflexi bacterium]|nr:tRNA guanosine(34) transglycosylase Tgt [Chloroflexota bacterium]
MGHAFKLIASCPTSSARAGQLETSHGVVLTPAFLPVGSQGAVKTLAPGDLATAGVSMVLGNTYHLYLRPGVETVAKLGGLHRFMAWDGPILTDSGGFQVFSLASLRRVTDEGVLFRSHVDGSEHFLSPELTTGIQERLGSDIAMVLDQCHEHSLGREDAREALDRTHRWAVRCLEAHRAPRQALYAIVQGGMVPALRRESARFLASLGFHGYAIGGLSVGEPRAATWNMLEESVTWLPSGSPRYLMGVGAPDDIIRGVARGVDLFDCVLPTRLGRHGVAFTGMGRLNLRNAAFAEKDEPLEADCDCYACRTFSRAYLHHLVRCDEMLVCRLLTLHNLRFMMTLMRRMREAIVQGSFASFHDEFLCSYVPPDENVRLEQKRRWLSGKARGALKA